jgi:hypothetical protein
VDGADKSASWSRGTAAARRNHGHVVRRSRELPIWAVRVQVRLRQVNLCVEGAVDARQMSDDAGCRVLHLGLEARKERAMGFLHYGSDLTISLDEMATKRATEAIASHATRGGWVTVADTERREWSFLVSAGIPIWISEDE